MKVLFFITNPQRMAGSNRTIFEIIKGLDSSINTSILFSGDGLAPSYFVKEGLTVDIEKPQGVVLNSYGKAALQLSPVQKVITVFKEYFPYAKNLYKYLKESNPDIVHCNDVRSMFLIGPAAKLLGKKVVLHIHTEYFCPKKAWLFFRFLPDHIVTVSQYIKDRLDSYSKKKTTRIYNGIKDCKNISATVPFLENRKTQGDVIIGCVASLIPFKSLHYLIDAANLLQEKGILNVVFVSIGPKFPEHEAYYKLLENRIMEYGLSNFILSGVQDNPYKFYNAMDICVLPSVSKDKIFIEGKEHDVQGNEGFPTTNLEAMLFEKPVVATAISGTPEQIEDGVSGYLVPPKDVNELSEKLENLINDKNLRIEMGKKGRDYVLTNFSSQQCVNQFTKVLEEITSSK